MNWTDLNLIPAMPEIVLLTVCLDTDCGQYV